MTTNFVDLPCGDGRLNSKYDELTANPNQWAEWWGTCVSAAHTAAKKAYRPGFRFETMIRSGTAYIRAVREDAA